MTDWMDRYMADPLNPTVPIPWSLYRYTLFGECECYPGAGHDHNCPRLPTYLETVLATGIYPPHLYTNRAWWDRRWVCFGRGMYEDQGHMGGEINGPTHWCEREGRIVTRDD